MEEVQYLRNLLQQEKNKNAVLTKQLAKALKQNRELKVILGESFEQFFARFVHAEKERRRNNVGTEESIGACEVDSGR